MSVLSVTIFQKELGKDLSLTNSKELRNLNSRFLLFPEHFYAKPSAKSFADIQDASTSCQKQLVLLSERYKGIIIGGSFVHKKDEKYYVGTPIFSNGSIVDWHDQRRLNALPGKEKKLSPGDTEGIFILDGVRFAVAFYSDIQAKDYIRNLSEQGIQLLFVLGNISTSQENVTNKKQTKEFMLELAKEFSLNIVLCCGVGTGFEGTLSGRSLIAIPKGLSWFVSSQEENNQILKTVMINWLMTLQ